MPTAQASDTVAQNPSGVQSHSLMPLLFGPAHLYRAARACMRRGSAPGADGVTWREYRHELKPNLAKLSELLRSGQWRPGPLRVVTIASYTGKQFAIHIPTAADRIVHQAMHTAIEPILESAAFSPWVAGYRPGRNRIDAVRAAALHVADGLGAVADIDVARASAGSSAAEATEWLAEYVHDGAFLALFRTALSGLPEPLAPGSGLAPLLINLRLSRVDRRLDGLAIVRFADNYCAFTPDADAADLAFERVAAALRAEELAPHPTKSRIRIGANPEDLFLIAG